MKNTLIILFSLLIIMPVTVNSQEDNTNRILEIEEEIAELESELESLKGEDNNSQSNKPNSINSKTYGKRSDPVPLGEFIEINDSYYGDGEKFDVTLNFKINDVVRGPEAYEILINENQFNEEAPEGLEWAIFDLEAEYIEGSEDYPLSPYVRFDIFDTSGKQVDQSDYGALSVYFSDTDIFPGVIHQGSEVYLVPEGEEFLIAMDAGDTYFFESK